MPTPRVPGRRRFEIVADAAWIDQLAQAARAADRSLSSYSRQAISEQMRRDAAATREKLRPR